MENLVRFYAGSKLPENPQDNYLYFILEQDTITQTLTGKGKIYKGSNLVAETSSSDLANLQSQMANILSQMNTMIKTHTDDINALDGRTDLLESGQAELTTKVSDLEESQSTLSSEVEALKNKDSVSISYLTTSQIDSAFEDSATE